MHLPDPIIAFFIQFPPLFTAPTYRKKLLLVCGTLLLQPLITTFLSADAPGRSRLVSCNIVVPSFLKNVLIVDKPKSIQTLL